MNTDNGYVPLLSGIGVSGYRSFSRWQELQFPSKVTVIAGINNSGKSNILRFLQEVLPKLRSKNRRTPANTTLQGLDHPIGFHPKPAFQVGTPFYLKPLPRQQDPIRNNGQVHPHELRTLQEAAMSLLDDGGCYWSIFEQQNNEWQTPRGRAEAVISRWPNWRAHSNSVLRELGGGVTDPTAVMASLLASIGGFERLPKVATISSARRVELTQEESDDSWLSGRGIVQRLAALQSPNYSEWGEGRRRWFAINRFIQTVLDDRRANINVPHDFSTIQVETPDRVLPLASLGSGIEQVIVLAAAATVTTGHLVCIEEPETNLHPLLQKKLIRYLTDETDNQYVIATHSSHLLDDARSTAYHVRLTSRGTTVQRALRPYELVDICNDLGYRPSDLLQANCIIWVEGPSDRIYVRHWLRLVAPDLAEGIDYSVMFYGGKLLAHLTVDDEALSDFIDLRHLNRASAIVIDADKRSAHAHINSTKKRIRDEFAKTASAPGLAWVTKCYTIENYVADTLLCRAVEAVHPGRKPSSKDQWENPLKTGKDEQPFDKIAIAREVEKMQEDEHLDRYDLRSCINDMVELIRKANGKSVTPSDS